MYCDILSLQESIQQLGSKMTEVATHYNADNDDTSKKELLELTEVMQGKQRQLRKLKDTRSKKQ